ncbi:MAG TPA: hypothetical protein VKA83_23315 [Methylomirabilota bacterium]|nr:hypothetical protein [Methylomirabilota bacterium]
MGAPKGLPEKTLAAIRARAKQLAAKAPLPGPEQIRLIAPLLGPRRDRARRDTDAA